MKSQYKNMVKKIIRSNFVMTLGTLDSGEVHLCTVLYVTRDTKTLYFKSRITSIHSKSFAENPRAAASVYHPKSTYSVKSGVQMKGRVTRVLTVKEMTQAIALYVKAFKGSEKKLKAVPDLISDFVASTLYKFEVDEVKFVDSTAGIHTLEYEKYQPRELI